MAKNKPTKAENKAIGVALSEYANGENPLLQQIEWDGNGEDFAFTVTDVLGGKHVNADVNEAIGTALEAMQDQKPEVVEAQAEEAEAQVAEDAAKGRTIVPKHYRDEYKARGNARHNSDWFAQTMATYCNSNGKKAEVQLDRVYAIAAANGIDKQWPTLNNGQQRMNAGNMTRRKALATGKLTIPGWIASPDIGAPDLTLDCSEWAKEVAEREAAKKAA